MKTTQRFLVMCFIAVMFEYSTRPWPGPGLNLDSLTEEADLIAVGQILSVTELGRTTAELGNRPFAAREMIAELRADNILKLKGTTAAPSSSLKIHFTQTDEFVGWVPIAPLSYRIFFLRESSGQVQPANRYYPSLVAVPSRVAHDGTALEGVIAELGAVMESEKATPQEKREAVVALDSTKNPAAVSALRRASTVQDPPLRLSIAAALLEHNDISMLEFAESVLREPDANFSPELLHNLSYGIFSGVKDERAIPSLSRLLRASSVETRRAAASALMHVGSTSCIEPLLSALNDADRDVRYYSVVGLAEITGQTNWRLNMEDFKSDEKKYLNHWHDWSQNR